MTSQLTLEMDARQALDRRVESVLLRGGLYEPAMELLRTLAQHKGAANPISIARLRDHAGAYDDRGKRRPGWSDREIKATVKELIERWGIPIGGSREKPYGYFLIVTAADRALALRPLRNELKSLARRFRALSSPHEMNEEFGQIAMELDREDPGRSAA